MKLQPFQPLKHYDKKNLPKDILAGIIIMAVSIPISMGYAREFDTLKSKKVPQSLEIGLFFCQIFIFII